MKPQIYRTVKLVKDCCIQNYLLLNMNSLKQFFLSDKFASPSLLPDSSITALEPFSHYLDWWL